MRGFDELDYYELLEVPPKASVDEIGRAYRLSQQTYGEGSLALYSVFESHDAAVIRERLDEAYRILSDRELRASYDEGRATETEASPDGARSLDSGARESVDPTGTIADVSSTASSEESSQHRMQELEREELQDPPIFEDETGDDFDGVRLRRTRLFRGYEIAEIAEVTKVSGTHLRNIEDENFIDLPADVYVRGFLTAYASTIGLDPELVVPSYMTRVKRARSAGQRSRFLGEP